MKRIISGMLAMLMLVALFSTTASAYYSEDTSTDYVNAGMSRATGKSLVTVVINGKRYSIPGGAESTVGYGYNNAYTYVYCCQAVCNDIYDFYKDNIIPWGCYCGKADGIFGPNTYDGILGFQKSNNLFHISGGWAELAEDGICGDGTWKRLAAMNELLNP